MNKPGKFSKLLLVFLISSISLFNFSSYAAAAVCEMNIEQEDPCCCASDCSSSEENPAHEVTVSGSCLCLIKQAADEPLVQKVLINSGSSINIDIAKLVKHGFAETPKSSRTFISLPENIPYVLKDIYLFNSIFRI